MTHSISSPIEFEQPLALAMTGGPEATMAIADRNRPTSSIASPRLAPAQTF